MDLSLELHWNLCSDPDCFYHGYFVFNEHLLFGFLECSGKLCSSQAVVVELAFREL